MLLSLLILAVSPLLLIAAVIADLLLPGNWRSVRLVGFVTCYLVLEVIGLIGMVGLWLVAGSGSRIRSDASLKAHFGFMRWWLRKLNHAAGVLFHLRVEIEDRPVPRPGPVLVFCRHAGPGNSMLLIGTILIGYRRNPRIVMLAKLQWEPLFDIMLNRLPNEFIQHDPERRHLYLDAISDLATNLGDQDAFVLFPEGKDFTPKVRMRAIEYLKSKGHASAAARAEKMKHVLPPRHGGVMAALESAPQADVVLVAHAVLEDVGTFKELWSRIPLAHPIVARYWRIPQSEVPRQKEQLIEWLYGWWETIDEWIEHRTVAVKGPS